MVKKNNQHINPETYLKHFAEDKFVYVIQLKNKFQKKLFREGIGHKMFTKRRYYNFPNRKNEPILENIFSNIENSDYNTILNNIKNRIDLGIDTKHLLADWILMMKFRSSKFRDNFSELVSWTEKTMERLRSQNVLSKEKEQELEQKGKSIGKKIQLSTFLEEEQYTKLRKSFFVNFMNKNWVIMESKSINFITSDNPGYSFTMSKDIVRLNLSPISSMYNLNHKDNSIHVFPLTYNKCLFLFPFTEVEVSKINDGGVEIILQKEIEFRECTTDEVNGVNDITASLAHELIVGKKEIDLNKYIKN